MQKVLDPLDVVHCGRDGAVQVPGGVEEHGRQLGGGHTETCGHQLAQMGGGSLDGQGTDDQQQAGPL